MEHNSVFSTAVDFVNNTSRSIFLTGRAGTGKTTFLKYMKEQSGKRSVVVAPTGVAAINAGGVTMHSFFQLPLGPYVPVSSRFSEGVTDKFTLFKNIRVSDEKRQLFRDLELLIIDEVSMVRSDTLDAMDAILRYFRKRPHLPFGGVQVLYIGDLFQLPPVMPENEWAILREHYQSEFFFHSKVVEQSPPIYIELKQIYRQNEQRFIDILNRIRNNEAEDADLQILNGRYKTDPVADKNYITLTSHNYKADRINQEELKKLPGKLFEFKGMVEGEFQEKSLPTDMTLQLKEGAQVMFIRNDKSEDRRYFNGKIATVKTIDDSGIRVLLNGDQEELLLEKETWNNIRYSYNAVDEKIDEEKLGSFSQYPVRLAWAITIHKSQGLTFEHAIIDAGESFAPGQVYVALSRCVSLEGLILHSRIDRQSISTHARVLEFSLKETKEEVLFKVLEEEKQIHQNSLLLQTFDMNRLVDVLDAYVTFAGGKKIHDPKEATRIALALLKAGKEQQQVAVKFITQLEGLIRESDFEKLKERSIKAIDYFSGNLIEKILQPLEDHIDSLKGVKKIRKYLKRVNDCRVEVVKKINSIRSACYGDESLNPNPELISMGVLPVLEKKKKPKAEKGSSLHETLTLLNQGSSMPEIAKKRELAFSTIEGHVAMLVKSGELEIHRVVDEHTVNKIVSVIRENQPASLTVVKQKLGDNYSFGQIRTVMNYLDFSGKEKAAE